MDKSPKRKKTHDSSLDMADPKRAKQEDLEVTGVSRSGRVRKKSSKLVDFESPDDLDSRYKSGRGSSTPNTAPGPGAVGRPRKQQQHPLEKPHQVNVRMDRPPNLLDGEELEFEGKTEPLSDSDSEMIYPPPDLEESDLEDSDEDEDEDDDMEAEDVMQGEGHGEPQASTAGRRDSVPGQQQPQQPQEGPTHTQSLYMMEKSTKKRLVIRDGKIVGRMKAQRKDKGKTRFTAYMLWAKEIRQELLRSNPDLDFATMSKRLGELWATVPNNEKYNWKRRAKRLAVKGYREPPASAASTSTSTVDTTRWKTPPSKSKFINKGSKGSGGGKQGAKVVQLGATTLVGSVPVSPPDSKSSKGGGGGLVADPVVGPGLYKVIGTQPVDVAAHLKLLGDSLTIIGERLQEHEGQIAVSGSLSVLLDSLLCALGPLLCLTQQVAETDGCPPELLSKVLDNIAYFMPGL